MANEFTNSPSDKMANQPEPANSSALNMVSRRFLAGLSDGIIIGAISAVTVSLQLLAAIRHVEIVPLACAALAAFCIAFCESLTGFGGIIYLIGLLLFGLNFGPSEAYFCYLMFVAFALPLNWLYHLIFEYSASRATPGKRLFGLQLCDRSFERPRWSSLTKRHSLRAVSALTMFFPIVHCLLGSRHQLIHDRLSGVYVVKTSDLEANHLSVLSSKSEGPPQAVCANLWRRIPAAMLDLIFFDSLASITTVGTVMLGAHMLSAPESQVVAVITLFLLVGVCSVFSVVLPMLIMATLESSSLQSTPGKLALGLVVTDASGRKISFAEALSKQVVQAFLYVSLIPVVLVASSAAALLNAADPNSEIAIYVSALILVSFYVLYGLAVCATFFKKKQSLLDYLCGRHVLVEHKLHSGNLIEVVK
ncbi:RDD family protein [Candidatus Obscuribacterales bacterium]|nr:RDD family protein [Candidatus Obscuribacterales bacterium]MBX3135989.1 RDD family protein [Candidatus Obscuribacterales bacterium]MBX3150980.1 RDD family protein [Candidatus Obscuribacterales bacterium]